MKNYSTFYGILLAGALCCSGSVAFAQDENEKGWVSASFETNSIIYRHESNPKVISAEEQPEDHVASNNYLKLDYTKGRFSTGLQLESYLPAIEGYPTELTGTKLTNLYVQWADRDFTITGGTFYDQFGSGLLFRAWEDRALGFNNALIGARATYSYKNLVNIKVLWGTPRYGMTYDTGTQVRGADLSLSLGDMFGWTNGALFLEGSALNRFEKLSMAQKETMNPNRMGYSGRINFETGGFSAKLEYVDNGNNYYEDAKLPNMDDKLRVRGNAQLIELGYNNNGLGIFLSGRRLEWMQSQISFNLQGIINSLNYIPAMSLQYSYLLTTLHPYTPQIGQVAPKGRNISGEIGGQADIFYAFRKGSTLGGKRGLKVHANFATYYSLEEGAGNVKSQELLLRDFSVDFEKWITRKFKLSMLYSMQEINPEYGLTPGTELAHILVGDMVYKFNSEYSLRWELQYLFGSEWESGDWMAALIEFNVAPKWSIFASDMYNNGNDVKDKRIHYYNAGISFAQSQTRLQLSYGRNRAGYVCSGGVCRKSPAYTGFNFAMTISF